MWKEIINIFSRKDMFEYSKNQTWSPLSFLCIFFFENRFTWNSDLTQNALEMKSESKFIYWRATATDKNQNLIVNVCMYAATAKGFVQTSPFFMNTHICWILKIDRQKCFSSPHLSNDFAFSNFNGQVWKFIKLNLIVAHSYFSFLLLTHNDKELDHIKWCLIT